MAQIPVHLIVVFILLILLSGYFSVVETAFASVNQIRLKTYVNKGRRGAKKALKISENYDEALSTILVGNNLVNIAAATLSAQIAADLWGPKLGVIISTFVVTLLVLIVGDILPKSLAKENAEVCSLITASSLSLIMRLFKPVTWLLLKIPKLVSRLLGFNPTGQSFTEEEIKVMLDMSEEEGNIKREEKELVRKSLDFDDLVVTEILLSRTNIIAASVQSSIEEIKEIFNKESHARIPVYRETIDNIVGILSARDFLTELVTNNEVDIIKILKEPIFVPDTTKVAELLPKLKKFKNNIAIVTDEYGGTAGLVTLEDILEKIVGDIYDIIDDQLDHENDDKIRRLDESSYLVDTELSLEDLAGLFKIERPETQCKTLGGWLSEIFQRVPVKGEEHVCQDLIFVIEEATEKRIKRVKIYTKGKQK